MRSGTRSECKTRWTPKGHRPLCRVKLGYEYCYLYTALCPYSGDLFSLILPDMTKDSFCIFTQHFSAHLQQAISVTDKESVLLIADGAGAHQGCICEQSGFKLHTLPSASPELNPTERFFEELRKKLANQIFENVEEVEDHLCQILHKYFDNPKLISQLTLYPYINTT